MILAHQLHALPEPYEATEDPAQGHDGLADRDREILAFEHQWWRRVGAKEQAIRETFAMSATRYYQLLNALIDTPEALAAEPVLVRRLRRQRAERTRSRDSWTEASGSPRMVNAGICEPMSASTSTTCPAKPTSATLRLRANPFTSHVRTVGRGCASPNLESWVQRVRAGNRIPGRRAGVEPGCRGPYAEMNWPDGREARFERPGGTRSPAEAHNRAGTADP